MATAPRKDSLPRPEEKISRELSLGLLCPHLGLYYKKTIIQNDTCATPFAPVLLPIAKTDPRNVHGQIPRNVHGQIKSQRNVVYIYTTGYYSDMKNCH